MAYLVTLKNDMKYVIDKNFSCTIDELLNEIFLELKHMKKAKNILKGLDTINESV